MKKLFVPIAIMATMLASCKKYELSEEIKLESLPTVTIKGTVFAVLNETNSSLEFQFAPMGTVVSVSIPYSDYDLTNTSSGYYVKTTTIDAKGNYELTVPVVSKGVKATISYADFTYNVRTLNKVGQEVIVVKHFSCLDRVIEKLGTGQSNNHIGIDAKYSVNATDPNAGAIVPTKTVTVSGKLEYYSKVNNTCTQEDLIDVPVGTKIKAIITLSDPNADTPSVPREHRVTATITIGASGGYEIKVPMAVGCVASIELYAEEYWTVNWVNPSCTSSGSTANDQLWRFELNGSIKAYDVSTPQINNDFIFARKDYVTDL